MHPFDFPTDTITVTGNQSDYFSFIDKTYFPICKNQQVLEIGPADGAHSTLITKQLPSYFEVVEGDANCIKSLEKISKIDKVVHNDIILELQKNSKKFDVCICLGVLYHLHSPLNLLELIVNKCQPKYILLDCATAPHPLVFNTEIINKTGQCQTVNDWKSCQLNFVAPFFIFNQSLHNIGYQLELANKQAVSWFPKSNGWTALWKLKE
jgi:2-polyprenyl-3-methyl-5-hydroxy-6-metoxy-1,4-benzoquinol methylase